MGPRKFELVRSTIGAVPDGQVLLRYRACGICQGTELHGPWLGEPGGQRRYPANLGHQGAGEVAAKGAGVENFQVGEGVVYLRGGSYRRYHVVPPDQLLRIPEGVSYEAATQAKEVAGMIYHVEAADVAAGDRVAIIGSGPMGILLLQVVRLRAPELIVATDLYDERLEYAGMFGADHVVNASREDQVERVKDLTGGGATVVVEASGAAGCLEAAARMARWEGRIMLWGTQNRPVTVNFEQLFKRRALSILAHWVSGDQLKQRIYTLRALRLLRQGLIQVEPLITHRFRLEQIEEAFRTMEETPEKVMKIVVIPD